MKTEELKKPLLSDEMIKDERLAIMKKGSFQTYATGVAHGMDKAREFYESRLSALLEQKEKELGEGKWIDVKERLPESYVDVLATNGGPAQVCFYIVGFKKWHSDSPVTHWMELPKPPAKQD